MPEDILVLEGFFCHLTDALPLLRSCPACTKQHPCCRSTGTTRDTTCSLSSHTLDKRRVQCRREFRAAWGAFCPRPRRHVCPPACCAWTVRRGNLSARDAYVPNTYAPKCLSVICCSGLQRKNISDLTTSNGHKPTYNVSIRRTIREDHNRSIATRTDCGGGPGFVQGNQ